MAIYTSYYGSKQVKGKAIAISLKVPEGFQGEHLPLFAPTQGLLNWWKASSKDAKAQEKYSDLFKQLMVKRQAEIFNWVDVNYKNPFNSSDDVTFLCYEKSGDFCHRHLVMECLKSYIDESEYGGEIESKSISREEYNQTEVEQISDASEPYIEVIENPVTTQPKAKQTRKAKDPSAPKTPRAKKPTKKELELLAAIEARKNFTLDTTEYELDPLVVFPDEHYINILSTELEIGFDIETLGNESPKNAFTPEQGEIRLIQAYLPSVDKTIVWDLGDINNHSYNAFGLDVLLKKLTSKKCRVFIHNASFEFKWIANKFKKPILNVVDSMILSQIYYAGLIRGFKKIGVDKPNSLQQVCLRLFNIKPDKQDQSYDYAMPLTNRQLNYAANDPKLTYQAGKKLLEMCELEGLSRVAEAEMMAIPAFGMMEYKGIPFCSDTARKLLADYEAEAEKAIKPWLERFPNTNPGSPKQVLECLKQLGVEPKNAEGKSCTDNPTLTPYALQDPLIDGLLFWRSLKKDCEYLEQYLECVTEQKGFKVIRTTYSQNAPQASGRTASSSPNLQNIPTPTPKRKKAGLKPIRTAFKAPEGYKMIIVDLAASHAQLARHVSQDKQLIESHQSGVKLHFYTVAGILQMRGIDATAKELSKAKKDPMHPLYQHVSELYDPAKTVFYGGLNLNGAATLQASFLKKADMLVDLKTCKSYVDGGRKAYAGLYKFQQKQIADANREQKRFQVMTDEGLKYVGVFRGYYGVAKSFDGGRLFIEKMPSKYSDDWQVSGTDAVSFAWLRPEGTIMKKALGLLALKYIFNPEWDAWLCEFTHDEVGVMVKEEYAYDCAKFTLETVTNCFKEFVPDYEAEDTDPNNYVVNSWADK
jgi:DNA polymerase I-like protein with 3'-5' exonuclease and polymerase domains